jgi:ribosomal protein S12 methylthiotransferase accessory factor
LDRAGAARRVGPLYALYREPGRHAVAEVLAG